MSGLYESSKILPALKALGYADIDFRSTIDGIDDSKFNADFYSPSTNTLILT
jgi:hypothetical protein